MGMLTPIESGVKRLCTDSGWFASMLIASWRDPAALEFYHKLRAEAFLPDDLLRVLPHHGTIYVVVLKAASSRIRTTLAAVSGRRTRRLKPAPRGEFRMVQGPRSMTVGSFYRLATTRRRSGFHSCAIPMRVPCPAGRTSSRISRSSVARR